MKNNAFINTTLGQLINNLDCRSYIFIFVGTSEDNKKLFQGKVYELLSKAEFYDEYNDQAVTGLTIEPLTGISILIPEV